MTDPNTPKLKEEKKKPKRCTDEAAKQKMTDPNTPKLKEEKEKKPKRWYMVVY